MDPATLIALATIIVILVMAAITLALSRSGRHK